MPDDINKSAGKVHRTRKGGKRLFLWEKRSIRGEVPLLVYGISSRDRVVTLHAHGTSKY